MNKQNTQIQWLKNPEELDKVVKQTVRKSNKILDVGCGLRPQDFFIPKVHVLVEPFQEYVEILINRFSKEPGVIIINDDSLNALGKFPDESFESAFLIDVIEHLEKRDGQILIQELMRVTSKQVIIFTPYGFMPQQYNADDRDAWGLGGTNYQEHRSGWLPEDFIGESWKFFVCKEFHFSDHLGQKFPEPYGAFWAICEKEKTAKTKEKVLVVNDSLSHSNNTSVERISHPQMAYSIAGFTKDFTPYGRGLQTKPMNNECDFISLFDYKILGSRPRKISTYFKALIQTVHTIKKNEFKSVISISDRKAQHFFLFIACMLSFTRFKKSGIEGLSDRAKNK